MNSNEFIIECLHRLATIRRAHCEAHKRVLMAQAEESCLTAEVTCLQELIRYQEIEEKITSEGVHDAHPHPEVVEE